MSCPDFFTFDGMIEARTVCFEERKSKGQFC